MRMFIVRIRASSCDEIKRTSERTILSQSMSNFEQPQTSYMIEVERAMSQERAVAKFTHNAFLVVTEIDIFRFYLTGGS